MKYLKKYNEDENDLEDLADCLQEIFDIYNILEYKDDAANVLPCWKHFKYNVSPHINHIAIYTTDSIQGLLKSKALSYKLKVPLVINKTETITLEEQTKVKVYGGIELGLNPQLVNAQPFVMFNLKTQSFGYGYNVTNKSHNIKYSRLLYKK